MMTKREIVKRAWEFKRPPYVPWNFSFTQGAWAKLVEHFGGAEQAEAALDNHYVPLGTDFGFYEDIGDNRFQDNFGVVWNRTVDKDIGIVEGEVLPEPTLKGYELPHPLDARYFENIPGRIDAHPDRFRVFSMGFTLFERAWTLRGMPNLLMDFHLNPGFAHELLEALTDYNIAQAREALKYDIDCIRFGDDWGQQQGLIMGPSCWKEFLYPCLKRIYQVVREAGKFVLIHCCGDVACLFDDLVEIGVNCFNPFQPEVMDVWSLLPKYHGRLAFYGGLSLQKTLPYGSVEDVRDESRRLLALGAEGGYVFSPSHDVVRGVPLENMLAFIKEAQAQPGYRAHYTTPTQE